MADLTIALVVAGLAGAVLAGAHLALLWWTAGPIARIPGPGLWLAAVLVVRVGVVVVGIVLVAGADVPALASATLGYLAARNLAVRWRVNPLRPATAS
jgi:F1F0 ATPase subunit 2